MTNEPLNLCNAILRAWFVHHRHYLERTKTFVLGFVFVFVLAHEQAIREHSSLTSAHASLSEIQRNMDIIIMLLHLVAQVIACSCAEDENQSFGSFWSKWIKAN